VKREINGAAEAGCGRPKWRHLYRLQAAILAGDAVFSAKGAAVPDEVRVTPEDLHLPAATVD
jgi:hypothetical protein